MNIKLLIVILVLSGYTSARAQNQYEIDSLSELLANKHLHDTARVDIYNELAFSLRAVDKDLALAYLDTAKILA
ncbi:MAG: hypothetical protein KDC07_11840, partial [Chitinophagaceae bacterium]|nr:hypothetical protein [Chitinophagaceae bacterium]